MLVHKVEMEISNVVVVPNHSRDLIELCHVETRILVNPIHENPLVLIGQGNCGLIQIL